MEEWILALFPFASRKEIQARWKHFRTCFKRALNAQNNAMSGQGRKNGAHNFTLSNCYSFYFTVESEQHNVI